MLKRFRNWFWKWRFNLFPAYFGTGAHISHIAPDWSEVRVTVPLSWRTRNYVGTTFGGSMYAAVDPIYMMMLIRALGPEYVVWDKVASIRFKSPGKTSLNAVFRLDGEEVRSIRLQLSCGPSVDRQYHVDLVDNSGKVYASVEKTVYIRRRKGPSFRDDGEECHGNAGGGVP